MDFADQVAMAIARCGDDEDEETTKKTKPPLRVLYVKVGEAPRIIEITHTLEAMQGLVGGLVECVQLADGVDLWCHEEALLQEQPRPNRFVRELGHDIYGDFFLARCNSEGETVSVTEPDIHKYAQVFKL